MRSSACVAALLAGAFVSASQVRRTGEARAREHARQGGTGPTRSSWSSWVRWTRKNKSGASIWRTGPIKAGGQTGGAKKASPPSEPDPKQTQQVKKP